MKRIALIVHQRSTKGKGPARRLRAAGKIPAVVYGKKIDPVPVTVDAHEFTKAMEQAGKNPLFELKIKDNGKQTERIALLKERQINPMDGQPVHLDFMEIAMDRTIDIAVPLQFTGKPRGVEMGGIFRATTRYIQVACLPTNIPEMISVDVSRLKIADVVQVGQISLPEGVTAIDPETKPLATVLSPKKGALLPEEEEAAAEGEEVPAEAAEGEAKPEGSEG